MSSVADRLDISRMSVEDMEDKENSINCGEDLQFMKFSDILFTDDNGLGLWFAMKPCPERRETRALVEKGGGQMVAKNYHPDCINLATVGQVMNDDQSRCRDWYSMTYIFDCCRANQLKDSSHYLFAKPLNQPKESVEQSQDKASTEGQNYSKSPELVDEDEELGATEQAPDVEDEELVVNTSEPEVEESEERSSKYFKENENQTPKKNAPESGQFGNYLQFLKDREVMDTPENLRRIKEAFKGMKDNKNLKNTVNESAKRGHYSLRTKTKKPPEKSFGKKIVDKMAEESDDSSETGSIVSDISSDDKEPKTSAQLNESRRKTIKAPKLPIKTTVKQNYTLTEDEAILEYIIKSKRFEELKGNSLWEDAEKERICEGRSWQSMKERFRKHIIRDITQFDIEKKYKKLIEKCFYSSDKTEINKSQTGFYSLEEDMHIINHVIKKNGFELVKGNTFWAEMETSFQRRKVCQSRTWQSLKERYIKRIVHNLYNYSVRKEIAEKMLSSVSGLTDDQKKSILRKLQKQNQLVPKNLNQSQKSKKA